jgi:hypothetical protein
MTFDGTLFDLKKIVDIVATLAEEDSPEPEIVMALKGVLSMSLSPCRQSVEVYIYDCESEPCPSSFYHAILV